MNTPIDDRARIKQTQQLFKFMMQTDTMLVCGITCNPDEPGKSFKFLKNPGVPDSDLITIFRTLAQQLENGTTKISIE